ncbi:putative nucleic acid-binding Zn ribbon protein [Pullulanibacillus pueri]|uniref:Inhibitor of sigma-G Gin n=1 Tax=Pullulanibacillus pueri TaxID=1437324 RepID=A0A8J2ZZE9_9BACL|nr:sigma factor G inhibitor Gin [Pullulanibacillus pueri]MBM7683983.1 putative nucleic acid-binding Zn ribbon protein [Pullulanibacillus pueri]GGH88382.1 hypothetical protein GCM10007096_40590 [Pullulanibacillus pueri]
MGTVVNIKDEKECIICEKKVEKGIHVCNQLICEKCQEEMIETDVSDVKYNFFIQKLGKLSLTIKEPRVAGEQMLK